MFPDFPGVEQKRDANLIATILSYMETPQYLRKRLFKIRPELRYAGILPPLRTAHHPLSKRIRDLAIGEYREGVVVSSDADGSFVDIGVERPILTPNTPLPLNNRVTVKITELGKHPKVALASQRDIKTYWGYRTTVVKDPFGQFIKKRHFDLVLATSRRGTPILELGDQLVRRWERSRRTLIAFGAPTQGLYEIVAHERLELDDVADFIINTIPCQGTETVRTEEALYVSLACLNLVAGKANP